ncbi:hypothetical protein [Microvirga rosea]|uniref:hypothetical protein n=1 Tax=Microvirga rosea TaxID=2715425 RepID=UPI0029CABCB1|nr:hypothetical protein [Microvirga rosea]
MDRPHLGIRLADQKAVEPTPALHGSALVLRVPVHGCRIPAKAASVRSSDKANQVGVCFGLVSSYSQKLVSGSGTAA